MYRRNPNNYQMMYRLFDRQIYPDYADWTTLWGSQDGGVRENYFVSYAMEGAMADPSSGTRAGLPVRHNLCNSPVENPSPLNSEGHINCPSIMAKVQHCGV